MKKNSILWIFSHSTYLERYAGLIEDLKKKQIDTKILLSVSDSDININQIILKYKKLEIKIFKHNEKLYFWEQVLNYSRIKTNLNLSISFKERYEFIVLPLRNIIDGFLKDKNKNGWRIAVSRVPSRYKFHLLIHAVGNRYLHNFLHFLAFKYFIRDKHLYKLIKEQPEEQIFFTYQGPQAETNALIRICKSLNKKVIFVQHNWDNLSSKELLYLKPDILGVWSYQCMIHATTVQQIHENSIRILGNYLIDQHLDFIEQNYLRHEGYVLYLGDSTNMDEYEILKTISEYLQGYKAKTGMDLFCYYRPHPYVNKKKYTEVNLPEYIRIDPEYEDIYFGKVSRVGALHFTNIMSLPTVIKYAGWVISGGTTAFIEACLHEKKVLLIDAPLRSVSVLSKTHFCGVSGIRGIMIVKQDNFTTDSMEVFIENNKTSTSLDDPGLKYFYGNRTSTSFIEKISSLVRELQSLN